MGWPLLAQRSGGLGQGPATFCRVLLSQPDQEAGKKGKGKGAKLVVAVGEMGGEAGKGSRTKTGDQAKCSDEGQLRWIEGQAVESQREGNAGSDTKSNAISNAAHYDDSNSKNNSEGNAGYNVSNNAGGDTFSYAYKNAQRKANSNA